MKRKRTFDTKSFELAEYFLQDYAQRLGYVQQEELTDKLAAHIQEAVEDWLSDLDRSLEADAFETASFHS